MTRRVLIAVLGALLLAAVGVTYSVFTTTHDRTPVAAADGLSLTGPRIMFRSTAPGSKGRLAMVAKNDPGGPRSVSALNCLRVYAAGGTGTCLRQDGALTTFQIAILDKNLQVQKAIPLVGVPNRTRVSADGRMAAWTVFVAGDSYNNGRFSTRSGLIDLKTLDMVDSLEFLSVTLDGHPYKAADLNFWGITFTADDNHFYATMSTAGHRYLVEGDIAARTVRTITVNVECPSLSPDGRRIAFKSAIDGNPAKGWRLTVLDLATGARTPLAETRTVDDQPAWLDSDTIGYAIPHGPADSDIWSVPANGSGHPALLIPQAESPAALN
ncbi:PD40 domain-containing protein [Kribbella kalugense]|uniref:WD40 repeat protein n=1 Tax=Kribbella kalugense TaxID=2512221 RepID=A0A4V3G888_9ACTN|nr:PD40 domain-containing protein [Kribbella kalugense]TDW22024.1 WD40 repeat protein [Kribbella kalugense]